MSPKHTRHDRLTWIWTFALVASLLIAPFPAHVASTTPSSTSRLEANQQSKDWKLPKSLAGENSLRNSYGKLPLTFEPNQGQVDQQVKFLARSAGYNLFLTSTEAILALNNGTSRSKDGAADRHAAKQELLKLRLVGGNPTPVVKGSDPLPGKSNYFHGNNPAQWQTGMSTYAKVRYHEVYPQIDMVYYGTHNQVEYDFELAPGADPNVVGLEFSGAQRIKIDKKGDLVIRTPSGKILKQAKPLIYQEVEGNRVEIAGGYVLASINKVGFRVGKYDRSLPLIIDPVVVFATYLGGNCSTCLPGNESPKGIATDAHGNTYVIGTTQTLDFPRMNPLQPSNNGAADVFVAKYNSDGSAFIYSTYLGGTADDSGVGIAADGAGNAYVTGSTSSVDFPITTGDHSPGTFITKLNSDGSALTYSVVAPGMLVKAIAVDHAGNAYLTGNALDGFPLVNPIQPIVTGFEEAFVAKLNANGSGLIYSTYLGGRASDTGNAIAVDDAGNAYVAGETSSGDFPTVNAEQPVSGGVTDAFVTKINAAGSAFIYSTYLGGTAVDRIIGIATNESGDAFVTGLTTSADFPTANALQPSRNGLVDAFVTRISANGSALVYSTYLGGGVGERGQGIAVDRQGNAYITGFTNSPDFPIVNAFQPMPGMTPGTITEAFVAKLTPSGTVLVYSSYLGGSGSEQGVGIAADNNGNAYVIGEVFSTDFPTVNPLQPQIAPVGDAFVAKIFDNSAPCGEDVTNRVTVLKSSVSDFLLPSLQFQLVAVVNKSNSPIRGPITFVPDDLNNSFLANFAAMTKCYTIGGDGYTTVKAGADNILSPGESVVFSLLFFRLNTNQRIQYHERVVSGTPST